MWVKAVEKAKSVDADKVIDALPGTETPNLTGGIAEGAAEPSHHQAGVHWRNQGQWPVRRGVEDARASSPATHGRRNSPDSKDLIGDWVGKKCGNYNTKTNKCGGQGS